MKAIISFNQYHLDLEVLSWNTNGTIITILATDGKSYSTGADNILIIEEYVKPSL